ncbi:DUF6688 domain-containing protein [Butyrivibrio proteoclasticus]|uniref:DUF6688 domain-containing protein n=1 Tax=Butyrivibrio proteoclasticus TaxID=43305 RepID=UPI000685C2D5|nr:DUF6688 family protein [Butyrivibrio proteoclasticus]
MNFIRKWFTLIGIGVLLILGVGFGTLGFISKYLGNGWGIRGFFNSCGACILLLMITAYPILLTITNILGLFDGLIGKISLRLNWAITLVLGVACSWLWYMFMADSYAPWYEALHYTKTHQIIWTGGLPSVIVLFLVGVIGFSVLALTGPRKLSPIVSVTCIAAMYIQVGVIIAFMVQVGPRINYWPIFLLPFNIFIMMGSLIKEKITEWNEVPEHSVDYYNKNDLMNSLNRKLANANTWPIYGLLFVLPLLGIVLIILTLFGQTPDKAIRAFTETADWTLSTKIAPQDLDYDMHYLCTVAAGGHRDIVKPVRMGQRHGHRVVVNRQLMVANAFENVLEEHTPHFHRAVRNFYDKYGFPISNYIRFNKTACDATYFIMKPLEWIFVIVLYLVDANPENRIAVQYLPVKK